MAKRCAGAGYGVGGRRGFGLRRFEGGDGYGARKVEKEKETVEERGAEVVVEGIRCELEKFGGESGRRGGSDARRWALCSRMGGSGWRRQVLAGSIRRSSRGTGADGRRNRARWWTGVQGAIGVYEKR
ncbi:uncharacterized protein A4U43_C08F22810 [Asparagus officinalis]|nr:uncharacterized protein A4U43_C08F22810 [Asparagus officinalis]